MVRGEEHYLRRAVRLEYDIPTIMRALRSDQRPPLDPCPTFVDIYYRTGSESAVTSTNHETIVHFMGMTTDEVLTNAAAHGADDAVVSLTSDKGAC
jgi:hypothetical protein